MCVCVCVCVCENLWFVIHTVCNIITCGKFHMTEEKLIVLVYYCHLYYCILSFTTDQKIYNGLRCRNVFAVSNLFLSQTFVSYLCDSWFGINSKVNNIYDGKLVQVLYNAFNISHAASRNVSHSIAHAYSIYKYLTKLFMFVLWNSWSLGEIYSWYLLQILRPVQYMVHIHRFF